MQLVDLLGSTYDEDKAIFLLIGSQSELSSYFRTQGFALHFDNSFPIFDKYAKTFIKIINFFRINHCPELTILKQPLC